MNKIKNNNTCKTKKNIRVFIVDDHPIVREGLITHINREPGLAVCGESDNAYQALESINTLSPDIVIADLSLGKKSGLDLIKEVSLKFPELPVVVLSMLDEMVYAERALRAGAKGYIMKQEATKKVLTAIRHVMAGELFVSGPVAAKVMNKLIGSKTPQGRYSVDLLTDRELEAFKLMGNGFGTRQISEQMKVGFKTAETYRTRIKAKLGFKNSAELIKYAVQWVMAEHKDE